MNKQQKTLLVVMSLLFLGFGVPLFTTLVIQNLWNWFVADAIHAANISYWQALGFAMLMYIVKQGKIQHELGQEVHWKKVFIMVKACIPLEELESVESATKELDNSWLASNGADVVEAITGAMFLTIGWGVHTFLM